MAANRRPASVWAGLVVLLLVAVAALYIGGREGSTEAGGPCLGAGHEVIGSETLTVKTSDTETEAALGWMRAANCPGVILNGGPLEADGFFWALDDSLVTLLPGEEFHVLGPGFRSSHMTADWVIDPTGVVDDDGTVWTLVAPEEPGRYEIDLGLRWDQGEAAYAALVEVSAP